MMSRATSFLSLQLLAAVLLSLLWAAMGSAVGLAERGEFSHSGIAAKKPDFIVTENGTAVSVSQTRMREGFDKAGFPSKPTDSPGIEHTLPDER